MQLKDYVASPEDTNETPKVVNDLDQSNQSDNGGEAQTEAP